MKAYRLFAVLICILALGRWGAAQSVDAFFGFNTLTANHNDMFPYMGGGFFPSVGGDLILFNAPFLGAWGVGGEVAWRGKQMVYTAQNGFVAPVRPILYDFNLVWEPVSLPRITPVIELGFGAESLRVYTPTFTCSSFSGCTNYQSSNHLMGHLGVGVRLYLTDHIFIQPDAHLYAIRHNLEFQVPNARRFGIAIGYTLRASPM